MDCSLYVFLQSKYRTNKMSTVHLASLGWLYLVQGIPYGLQDKFIPVQLRSHGLQYSRWAGLKLLVTQSL